MSGNLKIKVYYEDTDAGGVVYHANYLRFMERARTEFLAEAGVSIAEHHRKGRFLAVTHVDIRYRRPAHLGDVLEVTTEIVEVKQASVTARQKIFRDGKVVAEALITIASIDEKGKPRRLPDEMKRAVQEALGP